ncbi:RICIN domain-containing protein [Streptomyces sp. 1222.5]|uniref:RICIN domain-containing protein n=1 Tax=Streptomyces sp. 1222.5 TaxID=1881026 RepID=UPI003EBC5DD4
MHSTRTFNFVGIAAVGALLITVFPGAALATTSPKSQQSAQSASLVQNRASSFCIAAADMTGTSVRLQPCDPGNRMQHWVLDSSTYSIMNLATQKCITVPEGQIARLVKCDPRDPTQSWKREHFQNGEALVNRHGTQIRALVPENNRPNAQLTAGTHYNDQYSWRVAAHRVT